MHKIFFIFAFIIFSGIIFAQAPAKISRQLSKREQKIAKINYTLDGDTVIEFLRKCNNDIRRSIKDNEPLSSLKYFSFANTIKKWSEYRWFITDTGLSKKWLKRVEKLLFYMCKVQVYLAAEKFNGRTQSAKYKKTVEYFDVAYKRFVKLVKKPVKVSSKVQRRAKMKKVLWQKAMRKKYKIKDKEKTGLEGF